jgi:transcriptional regulator with XRE-family HTH domain
MTGTLYSDAYAAFVEVVVAARRTAGLTQADLASRLHRPQSFVSKSERKERRLDVVEFVEIAEALGLSPAELFARVLAALPGVVREDRAQDLERG